MTHYEKRVQRLEQSWPRWPIAVEDAKRRQLGPTGLNLRSHVICSICLSEKGLYQRCQVCLMVETAREIRL
jgi:hypothetical protein